MLKSEFCIPRVRTLLDSRYRKIKISFFYFTAAFFSYQTVDINYTNLCFFT